MNKKGRNVARKHKKKLERAKTKIKARRAAAVAAKPAKPAKPAKK